MTPRNAAKPHAHATPSSEFTRPVTLLAVAGTLLALHGAANAQSQWVGPSTNSRWSNPANWSPASVPNGTTVDAVLGLLGTSSSYTADGDQSVTLRSLSITNPDAVLQIWENRTFNIIGTATNPPSLNSLGQVIVHDGFSGNWTYLRFPVNNTRIRTTGPNGRITLNSTSEVRSAQLLTEGGGKAILEAGTIVEGRGSIYGRFDNYGTILGTSDIGFGPNIRANLVQFNDGKVSANGAPVFIDANGSVTNGILESSGAGFIGVFNGTLAGVTNTGNVLVYGNSTCTIGSAGMANAPAGILSVNDGVNGNWAYLQLAAGATLTGPNYTLKSTSEPRSAQVTSTNNNGDQAFLAPDSTILGNGTIYANLRSSGTIRGGSGALMRIRGPITQQVTGEPGIGRIFAGVSANLPEGVAIDAGGNIIRGTLETSSSGLIYGTGGAVTDVTLHGNLFVYPNNTLYVNGALTASPTGTVYVNDGANGNWAYLQLNAGATLTGGGRFILRSTLDPRTAQITSSNNNSDQAIIDIGTTVQGAGVIDANLRNKGTIRGGSTAIGMRIRGPVVQQVAGEQAVGRIFAGETAGVGEAVAIDAGGNVLRGTLETLGNGVIDGVGGTVTDVTNLGRMRAYPDFTTYISGSFVNGPSGTLTVNDGLNGNWAIVQLNAGAVFNGPGPLTLRSTADVRTAQVTTSNNNLDQATFAADALVQGRGQISGNLVFQGTLAPGNPGSIGALTLATNPLNMEPSAVLDVDLGGPAAAQRDKINVNNGAVVQLDGILRIRLLDGYTPPGCMAYPLITGGSISGNFAAIEQPPNLPGNFEVQISSNTVTLFYRLSSDFNRDTDFGTDQDIEAFFSCLAGQCCPACATSDYNGDGDFGTDQDIEAFFRVIAGLPC